MADKFINFGHFSNTIICAQSEHYDFQNTVHSQMLAAIVFEFYSTLKGQCLLFLNHANLNAEK